jgi:hypothetical protein
MPDPQLDLLVAYLRQHGDRFAVEALRRQMLSEGNDPALVEEAIRIHQSEKPAPPPRPVWPLALGIAFAHLAVLAVLGGLAVQFDHLIPERAWSALLLLPVLLLLEPIVAVVLIMMGGPLRRTGLGLLLGWAFFVGGVILLLGGFCLFLVTAYN